jgi:hypothetical protein
MKRTFSVILVLGLISLSGFIKESRNYEQITFDYFVSDILGSDFKDITSFEFKGKTEESYSTLGKYKFCLKPEEKLGSIIGDVSMGSRRNVKEIKYENIKGLTILEFQSKANGYRLFIYPSVHVADNYYVFLAFQKPKEQWFKYVFELTPEGNISRSCKMEHSH